MMNLELETLKQQARLSYSIAVLRGSSVRATRTRRTCTEKVCDLQWHTGKQTEIHTIKTAFAGLSFLKERWGLRAGLSHEKVERELLGSLPKKSFRRSLFFEFGGGRNGEVCIF